MKLEWKPVSGEDGAGSCMDCQKGTLRKNGNGLEYPYEYVCEIEIGRTVIRLCRECLEKLSFVSVNRLKQDY
jgi:hypothetical protein